MALGSVGGEWDWGPEDYLRTLWLHKWLILVSVVLCGGSMKLSMDQQPNVYEAIARVLIEVERARPVQFAELGPPSDTYDTKFLQTEYKIITSPAVMQKVVQQLHLADFPPFSKAQDPAAVLEGIVIVEPIRGTKLTDIKAEDTRPQLVARIVNAVADAYAQVNFERRQELTSGGVRWLQGEVAEMEKRLRAARLALQTFREKHGNVTFDKEQQSAILQRIQNLNTALTEVKKQLIDAVAKYRKKHPIVRELMARELEIQMALIDHEEWARQMERIAIEYDSAVREVKASEEIYNTLLTRLKELSIQEGLQTNNVQVVRYADVPQAPVWPKRTFYVTMAILVGLFLGVGLAVLREAYTKTLRNRQDFEKVLEIPFLGQVPFVKTNASHRHKEAPHLLIESDPRGAESIRTIRTTLEFLLPDKKSAALMITSSLPGEGKSLIWMNLAVAFQELDRKVVLIDADLRRPSYLRVLPGSKNVSLSSYLQGEAPLDQLVQSAEVGTSNPMRIPFIPAGTTSLHPSDLFSSPKMRELLEALKQRYQYCFIDTPPVLAVTDVAVLANVVDGILYVVRSHRTHRDIARMGKQQLVDVGAKLIGGILNAVKHEIGRGYPYYYYYSRDSRRKRQHGKPDFHPSSV